MWLNFMWTRVCTKLLCICFALQAKRHVVSVHTGFLAFTRGIQVGSSVRSEKHSSARGVHCVQRRGISGIYQWHPFIPVK